MFWGYFRAPLDVDGIFYHLPIILEALEKNVWGQWTVRFWQIQSTPKGAEIPNLLLVALGGDHGYRLAQFGHLSSALIGALAFSEIAKLAKLQKPSLFGLVYIFTPIVFKQMTSNYVDMAFYSYWLACAAFAARIATTSEARLKNTLLLGAASFLLVGTKLNGFVSLLAVTPILILPLFKDRAQNIRILKTSTVVLIFVIAGVAFWMIPNWSLWGNPVFPIRPTGLLPGNSFSVIPKEIPVTGLNGWLGNYTGPAWLSWVLLFFIFEPIAQYDICGGAWGFIGVWAMIGLTYFGLCNYKLFKIKPELNLVSAFWGSLVLTFLLTPGRIVPRYALLSGFIVIFPALVLLVRERLNKKMAALFKIMLVLQIFYILPERVLFRGVNQGDMSQNLKTINENFQDIIQHGEPQSPERWMHFPYVPTLRRDEPRSVSVGRDCVDLIALYYGREFKNRVTLSLECCRWPYECKNTY